MQSVSSRIWTRFAVSISYDDNHYTTVIIVSKGLLKGLKDLEIRGQVEIIQTTTQLNNESSPGDLRRLAVTQISVKEHQLTLMGKLSRSK